MKYYLARSSYESKEINVNRTENYLWIITDAVDLMCHNVKWCSSFRGCECSYHSPHETEQNCVMIDPINEKNLRRKREQIRYKAINANYKLQPRKCRFGKRWPGI